jgi:hypothetical protein
VKRHAFFATAAALGLALAVAGAVGARSNANTIRLTAALTAADEVPAPAGDVSAARGAFTVTATRSATGATLTWQLTFSGLTGAAAAAHIHTAARGVAGPVTVSLCGPCESGASGTAEVTTAVLESLQTGGTYANVHTAQNRGGEIRGQIAVQAAVRTVLTARQEVPRPKGKVNRARATFTATITKSDGGTAIVWRLTHGRLTGPAVAAHIHTGRAGRAGPVAISLCGPCRSVANGRATVNATTLAALEAGRAYVNIHTRRNPGGEVRGQIAAVPLTITG